MKNKGYKGREERGAQGHDSSGIITDMSARTAIRVVLPLSDSILWRLSGGTKWMHWSPFQEFYQLYLNAVLAQGPGQDWVSPHQLRGWAEETCSLVVVLPMCLLLGTPGIPQGEGRGALLLLWGDNGLWPLVDDMDHLLWCGYWWLEKCDSSHLNPFCPSDTVITQLLQMSNQTKPVNVVSFPEIQSSSKCRNEIVVPNSC